MECVCVCVCVCAEVIVDWESFLLTHPGGGGAFVTGCYLFLLYVRDPGSLLLYAEFPSVLVHRLLQGSLAHLYASNDTKV